MWDCRKTSSCVWDFTAHSGPVFALNFHPENKNILASAGRDRLIKVGSYTTPYPAGAAVGFVVPRSSVCLRCGSCRRATRLTLCSNLWTLYRPSPPSRGSSGARKGQRRLPALPCHSTSISTSGRSDGLSYRSPHSKGTRTLSPVRRSICGFFHALRPCHTLVKTSTNQRMHSIRKMRSLKAWHVHVFANNECS